MKQNENLNLPYFYDISTKTKATDLFNGKLGIAVAHLYHGSLENDELTYDFGYNVLMDVFNSLDATAFK